MESELHSEILKLKNFERLNNEKITPDFLKIARSTRSDDSLDNLCNDNDQIFGNEEERSEYITEYYENIYKKPVDNIAIVDPVLRQEEIRNFLGETADHQTVTNAKLTDAEKLNLESPLTIIEFEKSISESNRAGRASPK